ncbi:MAG: hypothetical protein GY737_01700 [Desulfobacteraceae bacterium]|nr:hypothetical protein [Desulfobacteraceae bacterium]
MGICETIVVPFLDEEGILVATVGINHDITVRKEAEEAMTKINISLENNVRERTHNLEEMNTALRVLLRKREQDQTETEEKVLSNIKTLIAPYLSRLRESTLNTSQRALIEILESNLAEIVSAFSRQLSATDVNLTPSEIRVANLIKQGKTNKEIARILFLSIRTISFHRENIRKKLDLTNKKINLKSYLTTMD